MLRRLLHRSRQHDDFGPPSEIPGLSLNADAAVPVLSDSAHYDDDDYDVDVPILRHVLRHNLTISQDNFCYMAYLKTYLTTKSYDLLRQFLSTNWLEIRAVRQLNRARAKQNQSSSVGFKIVLRQLKIISRHV